MTLCLVIVSSLFNDDQNAAVLTELWMTQSLSLRARPASVVWGPPFIHHSSAQQTLRGRTLQGMRAVQH